MRENGLFWRDNFNPQSYLYLIVRVLFEIHLKPTKQIWFRFINLYRAVGRGFILRIYEHAVRVSDPDSNRSVVRVSAPSHNATKYLMTTTGSVLPTRMSLLMDLIRLRDSSLNNIMPCNIKNKVRRPINAARTQCWMSYWCRPYGV